MRVAVANDFTVGVCRYGIQDESQHTLIEACYHAHSGQTIHYENGLLTFYTIVKVSSGGGGGGGVSQT